MHAGKPTVWEYSKNIENNTNSQALNSWSLRKRRGNKPGMHCLLMRLNTSCMISRMQNFLCMSMYYNMSQMCVSSIIMVDSVGY